MPHRALKYQFAEVDTEHTCLPYLADKCPSTIIQRDSFRFVLPPRQLSHGQQPIESAHCTVGEYEYTYATTYHTIIQSN